MKTNQAFWDTSAIVPLCCKQDNSQRLRQLRRAYVVVAWWGTSIEAHSALSRLYSEGVLSKRNYDVAIDRLQIQKKTWREMLPSDKVKEIAEGLPEAHGLRTLDSMQLASALVWCNEKPSGRIFICCDSRLSDIAAKVGFTVLP